MLKESLEKLIQAAEDHELYINVAETDGNIVTHRGNLDHPEYLFIGEAPGRDENATGEPFVGKAGVLLDEWLKSSNIGDYAIINTIPIIPLDNNNQLRLPTKEEIEYFKPYIQNLINDMSPQYIICLGKSALSFFELDIPESTWDNNIGFVKHPAYYLRQKRKGLTEFQQLLTNKGDKKLKTEFIINRQQADNLGHKEMISGLLAGLHSFAQQASLHFKDINQKDECILGDKKIKIYTRDILRRINNEK